MVETETTWVRFAKRITPLRKARRWFLNAVWSDFRLYCLTMLGYFLAPRKEFLFTAVRRPPCPHEFHPLALAVFQPGRAFRGRAFHHRQ